MVAVVDLESQRGGRDKICAEQPPLRCRAVQTSRTHADPRCQGAASCCVGGPLPLTFIRLPKRAVTPREAEENFEVLYHVGPLDVAILNKEINLR